MPAKKRATPTSARRPSGAVAPRATSQLVPTAPQPRFTRDMILGWGALTGAVLALIGLNIASLILLVALGYTAAAFLRAPLKRDWRLRQAAWAITLLAVLAAVFTGAMLGYSRNDPTKDTVNPYTYLPMGVATAVLATLLMFVLAVAAILAAKAFGRQGSERYRLLSRASVAMLFYMVLLLPGTVVTTPTLAPLGSASRTPLAYLTLVSGLITTVILACAFFWARSTREPTAEDAARLSPADREYLLFAGAAALLLPRLFGLAAIPWSRLQRTTDETTQEVVIRGAASVATILLPLVLTAAAAAAFWVSCRQEGWEPSRWLARPHTGPVLARTGATSAGAAEESYAGATEPGAAAERSVTLAWLRRLLLTWRLPLLYGWLSALAAACSFLSWYGLLAAVPAAAHYGWMLLRERASLQTA